MPDLNSTKLVKFGDWTLRVRPSGSTPARLLLMVHGWTGDENSMWVFANALRADQWVVAPRAPYPTEPGGYSWRKLVGLREGPPPMEALKPAVPMLMELVDQYAAAEGIDAGQFDLIGFSQGAALGVLTAMLHPERIGKLCVLSGFVPEGSDVLVGTRPLAGKKVFVAHGSSDSMVPIDRARLSVELLEKAGAEVDYCEAEVGHKVSANCLRALGAYLQN
jgi:phospholipase/carboxylesterase